MDNNVLLAHSPVKLQQMINNLEGNCQMWNLQINLMKSKIIVSTMEAGLSKFQRWNFGGNPIKIEIEYKYLGIIITPRLALGCHFTEQVSHAKFGMNSAWRNFMVHKSVPYTSKLDVYKSVSQAVVCYAG